MCTYRSIVRRDSTTYRYFYLVNYSRNADFALPPRPSGTGAMEVAPELGTGSGSFFLAVCETFSVSSRTGARPSVSESRVPKTEKRSIVRYGLGRARVRTERVRAYLCKLTFYRFVIRKRACVCARPYTRVRRV